MQFIKISCISLLCSIFVIVNLNAQEIRTNENGEKIIVYPDGKWEYFDQSKNAQRDSLGLADAESNRYPTFSGNVSPLENPISFTEEDARKIAIRHAQIARDASSIAQRRAEDAKYNRQKLESLLKSENIDPQQAEQLNKRLELAIQTEQRTVKEAMLAMQEYENAESDLQQGRFNEEVEEEITAREAFEADKTRSFANLDKFYQELPVMDLPFETAYNGGVRQQSEKECIYDYEGYDKMNGLWRKDLRRETLFTYTDDRLRMYLKDREYLKCEAFMTSLGGGYRILSLRFSFAYPNAREAYGFIEKGSMLIIRLLNGGFIQLHSGKMDSGHYDTEQELLTYEVNYPISQSYINSLKNSEVDSIIVSWSSGYEEYEVYNLDFFQNQIGCLQK